MGGIYAREEGQPEAVWKAIYHHYLPVAVEADAPPGREALGAAAVSWAAVSLADKLDTVAGLLFAGERATGSRDPFGLRRQMHGIVRILMDLPELTGIERELGVRGAGGAGARRRSASRPTAGSQAATFAVERVRFALERARLPGRDRRGGDRGAGGGTAAGAAARPGAAGPAVVGGLPGARGAVQAGQEHREGAVRHGGARSRRAHRAGRARPARGARRAPAGGGGGRRVGRLSPAPSRRSRRCARPSIGSSRKCSSWRRTRA